MCTLLAGAVFVADVGCAPRLPEPAAALEGDPKPEPMAVAYPPPAALPEEVPPAPEDDAAVWLDGHWRWTGDGYRWIEGAWVTPPSGARYRPMTVVRTLDGKLSYYPPRWYGW